jgi:hypothetical protein
MVGSNKFLSDFRMLIFLEILCFTESDTKDILIFW